MQLTHRSADRKSGGLSESICAGFGGRGDRAGGVGDLPRAITSHMTSTGAAGAAIGGAMKAGAGAAGSGAPAACTQNEKCGMEGKGDACIQR